MKLLSYIIIGALCAFSSCKQHTDPDQLINSKASLPESFNLSALHQKVITSFINKRDSTMSILYGNEAASKALGKDVQPGVANASYTLVTWRQQDDPHWFGARIPGDLLTVETLKLDKDTLSYQKYAGKNLRRLADTTGRSARINLLLAQNPSITP
jgi:hypothetical protein